MGKKKGDFVNAQSSARIKVNGKIVDFFDANECLQFLLAQLDMKHSPFKTLKENVDKILDVFLWCCEDLREGKKGTEKARLTKVINEVDNMRLRWLNAKTVEHLQTLVYDKLLSLQNLSTLPGFSAVTRFGDKLYGNPEKVSVDKLWAKI